jgi:hypothetical protein
MIFLENKFKKWYFSLINGASLRGWDRKTAPIYVERHHIIPKSLGGINNTENLVFLSSREHFIAHKLLIKMTEGKFKTKMVHALWRMATGNLSLNSKDYEYARLLNSIAPGPNKGKVVPKLVRDKISQSSCGIKNHFYGKQHSEETKKLISEKTKEAITPEIRKKISDARIRIGCPESTKNKLSKEYIIIFRMEQNDKLKI